MPIAPKIQRKRSRSRPNTARWRKPFVLYDFAQPHVVQNFQPHSLVGTDPFVQPHAESG